MAPQACLTETIQPTPKRSWSIPYFGAQNVFSSGIVINPPSPKAAKTRSASASSATVIESEKPSKFASPSQRPSDAISNVSNPQRGVHDLVFETFRQPALFFRRVLETRGHYHLGTEHLAIKLDGFFTAAAEE
jgi:hypothetical protein